MDSVQEKLLRSGYEDVKLLTDVYDDALVAITTITELCTITT